MVADLEEVLSVWCLTVSYQQQRRRVRRPVYWLAGTARFVRHSKRYRFSEIRV